MRVYFLLVLVLALDFQARASSVGGAPVQAGDAPWTDVPSYPKLVLIGGTAAYFAPELSANYFYYDGTYWVYQSDEWYRCAWYNGPWAKVSPLAVPLAVLQIPVAYYNRPPAYFSVGRPDAPPRWDVHWGPAWAHYRGVWDRPTRGAVVVPAPKPDYQRFYAGVSYPDVSQQLTLRAHYYPYLPHELPANPSNDASMNASATALLPGIATPLATAATSGR
jgi:hypothetical protein